MLWWFDLIAAAAIAALGIHWVVERRRLFRFVASVGPSSGDPGQRALAFAAQMSNRPWSPKDPPYLAPALAPFGATPSAVIQRGGCCSGTSRLYILCLAAIGIRANQITVYHRSEPPRFFRRTPGLSQPSPLTEADPGMLTGN